MSYPLRLNMKQVDIVIQRKREEAEEVHKSNAR